MLGGFAVIPVEFLFSLTDRPSVRKSEAVAKSGQELVGVFDMFNSSILSFRVIQTSSAETC
jgi:hypothetical protein